MKYWELYWVSDYICCMWNPQMQLLKVHWFVVVEFISCNQAEKIWANDYVKSAGSRVERSRAVFCTCEYCSSWAYVYFIWTNLFQSWNRTILTSLKLFHTYTRCLLSLLAYYFLHIIRNPESVKYYTWIIHFISY